MNGSRQRGLPVAYGKDYLVLLVEDPFNLFAYWEITSGRRDLARSYLGPSQSEGGLAVRLLARDADGYRLLAARPATAIGQAYFSGLEPGQTYEAELGLTGDRGGFLVLLRSNPATTPSLSSAPRTMPEVTDTLTMAIPLDLGHRS
ncbi:MAG: DUF4912 domain-containing protein [Clostridia bacterium]|nr:MAG: DUF4912 domain-containing protein [Clostridia bacterium]